MKVMVISDIHGDIECLKKAIEIYEQENVEKLLILGDFLSYYYSITDSDVAKILNNMAGVIIAVKGNCDSSNIDEMFKFELGYTKNIGVNGMKITLTHGHIYSSNNLPDECGKIFLSGHTHCGVIEKMGERIIANPGSISKPRGGSKRSYIILDEENIYLKKLNNSETIKKCTI